MSDDLIGVRPTSSLQTRILNLLTDSEWHSCDYVTGQLRSNVFATAASLRELTELDILERQMQNGRFQFRLVGSVDDHE